MSSTRTGWSSVQLGDVANLLTGFPFKSHGYSTEPSDPRLIGGDNIVQGHLRWDKTRRWPTSRTVGLEDYWLRSGDVVLAMDRPWIEAGLKRATIRPDDLPALLIQRTARLRGSQVLDGAFLRYVIDAPTFTHHILAVQTGTAIPHISPSQILEYRFLLPPLEIQRAITRILSAFDDKIILNRQVSEALEALARVLFNALFEIYPSKEPIVHGQLPQTLQDILTLHYGKGLRKADRRPGTIPVFGSGGVFDYHDKALIGGPSIIVGRKGTVGSLYWVDGPSHPGDTVFYVESNYPLTYCFYLLQTLPLNKLNTDAAVPGLNRNNAYRLEVPSAPRAQIDKFDALVAPIRERIRVSVEESETLATIRDTLLPKLISGELRIKDAERLVSEVV